VNNSPTPVPAEKLYNTALKLAGKEGNTEILKLLEDSSARQ